jgi:predicted TIM-barrel fold metal-dependent hydrolase
MHGQPVDQARATRFRTPPPRKIRGPLVDMHTHMTEPATNHELVDAARLYGISRIVAIAPLDAGLALAAQYPHEVAVAARALVHGSHDTMPVEDRTVEMIPRAQARGVRIIKFWFAPRIRDRLDFLLDSPRLDRVFAAIAAHGMGVLVHVSDPDRWFERKYPPATYGTKADQYPMLETRLRQFPTVPFLAAHMGGDPEHLDHLTALLTRYPNLYLDTSATKWIVRELGRQREAAREFFRRWADRICFGTDQVVIKEADPERYAVRYWVHQMFWETDLETASPIPDPDSEGTPHLRGLDLPEEVLEQIYWKNAERVFGISARSGTPVRTRSEDLDLSG